MNSSQVIDLINRFEKRYPVATWKIEGIHVWPIMRARIYSAIIQHYLSPDAHPASRLQRLRRLLATPANILKMLWATLCDFNHSRFLLRPADILILGDGTGFSKIERCWYDRVMDPLVARFLERDLSSFLMSPGWWSYHPRHTPSRFIQLQLELRKVLATLRSRLASKAAPANLEGLEGMLAELRKRPDGAYIPDERWLREHWARVSALSFFFSHVIRRVKPKAALVNTYYCAEGLAFCLACRRAGVPVADVQHGSQGWEHMAYSSWVAVPLGGYELFPDRFWVWSQAEAAPIDAWSAAAGRNSVVIGNAWSHIWRKGTDQFVANILKRALALRNAAEARYHVLLALTTGYSDEALALLFRAASRFPPGEFFWWIRLHPGQLDLLKHYAVLARSCGLENFNIVDATELPLHAVLHAVDLQVTPGSTTILEGASFGLRTIITSSYGADAFKDTLASGVSVAALTEDDLVAAITRTVALGKLPVPAHNTAEGELFAGAWEDLLGAAGHKNVKP